MLFILFGWIIGLNLKIQKEIHRERKAKEEYENKITEAKIESAKKAKTAEYDELEKAVEVAPTYREKLELLMKFIDEHLNDESKD